MNAIEAALDALEEHEWLNLHGEPYMQEAQKKTIAAIIKRELEKAVPAKVPTDARYPDEYDRGHNECRKAFLGE